ncbi:MAG TPA: hypothetical protein VNH84_02285, partial [Candidatus Saccharimonadales bacterium]|nr:hypothetical protein [Candidatus Saccharimonadales bacterium]
MRERDWQPIATAPKDFGWMLGYNAECGVAVYCRLDGQLLSVAVDNLTKRLKLVDFWPPTVWMPLPAGPVAAPVEAARQQDSTEILMQIGAYCQHRAWCAQRLRSSQCSCGLQQAQEALIAAVAAPRPDLFPAL